MSREAAPRWVLSFADLSLLLLAFFIMLHVQAADRLRIAAGIRAAFGGTPPEPDASHDFVAAEIFQPGEAVLDREAAARLRATGAAAARAGARIVVVSDGRDGETARLDSWELAAARATAIARAIRAGGLADTMIEISMPPMRADDPVRGQRLSLRQLSGPAPR